MFAEPRIKNVDLYILRTYSVIFATASLLIIIFPPSFRIKINVLTTNISKNDEDRTVQARQTYHLISQASYVTMLMYLVRLTRLELAQLKIATTTSR